MLIFRERVENVGGYIGLALQGKGSCGAVGEYNGYAVGVCTESGSGIFERVDHHHIEILATKLFTAVFDSVIGFQGETHEKLILALACAKGCGYVGIFH